MTSKLCKALLDKSAMEEDSVRALALQGTSNMPGGLEKSKIPGRFSPCVSATGIDAFRNVYFASSKYHLPGAITGTHSEAPLRNFSSVGITVFTVSA
jgi:hypothetical protein